MLLRKITRMWFSPSTKLTSIKPKLLSETQGKLRGIYGKLHRGRGGMKAGMNYLLSRVDTNNCTFFSFHHYFWCFYSVNIKRTSIQSQKAYEAHSKLRLHDCMGSSLTVTLQFITRMLGKQKHHCFNFTKSPGFLPLLWVPIKVPSDNEC